MSRLRKLVREIHRRSLWQVMAIYLAGSWVALQVVREMTLTLGLPDWVPPSALALLVVGFPVVMATAFVQEGPSGADDTVPAGSRPESIRGTPDGRWRSDPSVVPDPAAGRPTTGGITVLRRWLTWKRSLLAGALAFAAWGLVTAGWLALSGEGPMGAGSRAGIRSLAVLPLDNFTGEEEQEHLVAGIHEALISGLHRVGSLSVTSRTSVMRYGEERKPIPEIARELNGVDAVVEGSVFKAGDSLKVTVQLVDARTDRHLWSGEYWGNLSGILELQRRVARAIAEEIRGVLSPEEADRLTGGRVLAPRAVELYLEGRSSFLSGRPPENLARSIRLYERALEIEPEYALAWAGLADAYLVYAHIGMDPRRAFPEAKAAARRALALDEGLAEAHVALADALFHYDWAWEEAERGFRRALEISPSYATAHWWYSGLLAALGRLDEAARRITRARELDPLTPQNHEFAVRILYYAGRHGDALDVWRRMEERGLTGPLGAWSALAMHRSGRSGEALRLVGSTSRGTDNPYVSAARGQIYAESGREEEARAILGRLEASYREGRMFLPHLAAIVHASLGDRDAALDWLEEGAEVRDGALPWLGVEPAFEGLRDDPRFRALLDRMRLSDAHPLKQAGVPVGPRPSPPSAEPPGGLSFPPPRPSEAGPAAGG